MPSGGKKIDDFALDFFDMDVDLDNPFSEGTKDKPAKTRPAARPAPKPPVTGIHVTDVPGSAAKTVEHPAYESRKRSSKDFSPDMDALLITAQSPMIIEGIKNYIQGDFSSGTLSTYLEALKGVSLYIKILDRNPNNYNKLKALIDSDTDCREVESFALNLFKKIHNYPPETEQEKLNAFERFEAILREAANKSSISNSMRILKKYLLMSGNIDEIKVKELHAAGNPEYLSDINNFINHLKLAIDLVNKGKAEIAKGLKGRDINIYIIKTSYIIYYHYQLSCNDQAADMYARINNNYKKYFIIRE
jgi:hypothetical protein